MGGHSVKGVFSRATRPPSWSTLTQTGTSGTSCSASNATSATCSGSTMLRAKRMTPPRPNSLAIDRSSTGMAAPSNPATSS